MHSRNKQIVVTGGAGFIGSHCVDRLLRAGYHVTVIDNLSSGNINNLDTKHEELEFIEGDVSDRQLLESVLLNASHVLHLAAQVSVTRSVEFPLETLRDNTMGFTQLIDLLRGKNIRLVYASSAAIYGAPIALPCSESLANDSTSLSPYALSKRENENVAELYRHLFNVSSMGLRFFNVYGPGQDPSSNQYGVIAKFCHDALLDKTLPIDGDGEQTRDFIHVKDVAKACHLALCSNDNSILNIASGKSISINQLLKQIQIVLNKKINTTNRPAQKGQIKHSVADVSLAKSILDFSTNTELKHGLQTTIDWLKTEFSLET